MMRKRFVMCAAVLPVILAAPMGLSAATRATATIKAEVSSQMKEAKRVSYELRETADRLHSISRRGGHSWTGHAEYLNAAREDVNRLGKMLASLEDLKPHASEAQQMAIETMRPRLVQTANALTNAIELMKLRPHNVYFSEYGEAVGTVSAQADSLHQTLDTVLKYEAAKSRLEGLELGPATESQS
jgi:hypothetical protein